MGRRILGNEYEARYLFDISEAKAFANRIAEHRISLFELEDVFLGETIDWHLDYKTNRRWPRKFAFGIDWRKTEIGGVKYVWEINRHQFIVPLAKAYFITHDEVYGQECLNLLVDWVENNKALEGINWASPLEQSIRLISWTFGLHLLRDMLDLNDPRLQKIIGAISLQARLVKKNLSRFSSANNHRIGEVAGLAVTGLGFPGLSGSQRWADKGLGFLQEEILSQIYEDGVGKEQSTGYLCFILDLSLAAFSFARMRGRTIKEKVWERIEAACNYLVTISEDSTTVPRIGDEDDAYAIRFDDSVDNARAVLCTVGMIRNVRHFTEWAGPLHEKAYWLAGPKLPEPGGVMSHNHQQTTSQAFATGGYYLMEATLKNRTVSALLDCGPLGYLSIAAHGHSDALSFVLRHGKEAILIDPGTYLYQCGGAWRDYFKSTSAHNTVTVDGKNQSASGGTFLWTSHAQSFAEVWGSTSDLDVFIGSHDGYTHLEDPVIHRRAVVFIKPDILLLIDKFLGSGDHHYEQHFHFHPDIESWRVSDHHWLFRGKETYGYLICCPLPGSETFSLKGAESPMLGWYSPAFGIKQPSTTILNSFHGHGDAALVSLVALKTDFVTFESSLAGELVAIDVKSDSRSYSVLFSKDLAAPINGPYKKLSESALGIITCDQREVFGVSKDYGLKRL
jgi:hypothetical protein